jgi:hypothetical protein
MFKQKDDWEHNGYCAPILIPLSGKTNKVPMPQTANTQAFRFGVFLGPWQSELPS